MRKTMKAICKNVTFLLLLLMAVGLGICNFQLNVSAMDIVGSLVYEPTIRMGDYAPMTRDEFVEWRIQKNFRFINIDGRIYPVGFFFDWHNGQAFSYRALDDGNLEVTLRHGVVSGNRVSIEAPVAEINQTKDNAMPVLFDCVKPVFFTDEELTIMIERVPRENPMDTRSAITLPNRRLTEYELEAWIDEYNEMGGATAFELAVVREINRVRVEYGLHPLALNPALMMSARLKAQEFGDLQYYNHTSIVHGTVSEAAHMFGFEGMAWENMSKVGSSGPPVFTSTAERVVGGMLASTRGHRETLLSPDVYSVGFGSFFSPNSTGSCGRMTHMFYQATKFEFIPSWLLS